ncbi:MAG: TlpA disulfide reductase family protein [Humidesulfovibrio sp.]|uniref:TlpA family protein disulfide reductase n=1 Tax=Humidesulfovibrio sp. TaxID=2910988 RepID=UPI0027EAC7CB|nr:TlpA disulfide reductase family protein [Humidesulfovibrio sp.]MDQ7835665.1 TlpA disulfide reductase family protein [Humidesulfovibrio sp.]
MTKTLMKFTLLLVLAACLGLLPACSGEGKPGAQEKFDSVDMPGLNKLIAANKGKVTLIMFWATWCPACKTELPVLEQLRAKYPKEKLDILALSVDDTDQAMREYLKTRPTTLTVLMAKGDVSSEFGVRSIPSLVIFDGEGQVAFNSAGAYPFEMLDPVIGQLVKAQ